VQLAYAAVLVLLGPVVNPAASESGRLARRRSQCSGYASESQPFVRADTRGGVVAGIVARQWSAMRAGRAVVADGVDAGLRGTIEDGATSLSVSASALTDARLCMAVGLGFEHGHDRKVRAAHRADPR
jgi:hypothetical protein